VQCDPRLSGSPDRGLCHLWADGVRGRPRELHSGEDSGNEVAGVESGDNICGGETGEGTLSIEFILVVCAG